MSQGAEHTEENAMPTDVEERPIYQLCEWYALCMNAAVGTTKHPILGDVPICVRCAEKHSLNVTRYPVES